LLTRPEPLEILQKFYLTAKPIGFWGPVRSSLGMVSNKEELSGLRRDLMACGLGVVFYFLLTTSLFSLMGGHILQGVLALAGAILSGVTFARTAISRLKSTATAATVLTGD
jgi:hypothetical protein